MKIGCVLLASGLAERFGRNKLLEKVQGKTLVQRTIDALPRNLLYDIVVVTAYDEIERLAKERGLRVVRNHSPQSGINLTIGLGLQQLTDTDACMFCVCDQPYMKHATLHSLVAGHTGGIVALAYGGQRGNPVIFPRALYGELLSLGPGESGRTVIGGHRELLRLHPARSRRELKDVDFEEDLARLMKKPFVGRTQDVGILAPRWRATQPCRSMKRCFAE